MSKPHNNSFESKFNPHPHFLKQGAATVAPFSARMENLAGSVCVACNKTLTVADMHRKGPHSKVELGLCGSCAYHVLNYRKVGGGEESDPFLDDIEDESLADALGEAGFGGSFGVYSE